MNSRFPLATDERQITPPLAHVTASVYAGGVQVGKDDEKNSVRQRIDVRQVVQPKKSGRLSL